LWLPSPLLVVSTHYLYRLSTRFMTYKYISLQIVYLTISFMQFCDPLPHAWYFFSLLLNNSLLAELLMSSGNLFHGPAVLIVNEGFLGSALAYCTLESVLPCCLPCSLSMFSGRSLEQFGSCILC
jgi:hypothetical protein